MNAKADQPQEERGLVPSTQAGRVVTLDETAMSVQQIVAQVQRIQDIMKAVMKDGEHYGTIPGCKHPSLMKPGAEKLSVTFRLIPSYEIRRSDLPNGHREYEVICTLTHGPSGQVFGQGVGSCSTMEGKYRFRAGGDVEFTGQPVPKAYWDDPTRDKRHLGGAGYVVKKNPDTGKWEIAVRGERVEHDNPADYYNTVLKMGKKRAHVDAVLTSTAASDIFTQDLEETFQEEDGGDFPPNPPGSPPQGSTKQGGASQPSSQSTRTGAQEKQQKSAAPLSQAELIEAGKRLAMSSDSFEEIRDWMNDHRHEIQAIEPPKVRADFRRSLQLAAQAKRPQQPATTAAA